MNTERKRTLWGCLFTVTIITAMTAAGELLGNREIIFPEIAALGAGCLLAPGLPWKTSPGEMILLISLCASAGLCLVLFVPGPMLLRVLLAYAFCQLLMILRQTGFAPVISAAILPVMINTRSMIYPVSACIFTALTVALMKLQKRGLSAAEHPPQKASEKQDSLLLQLLPGLAAPDRRHQLQQAFLRLLAVGFLAGAAISADLRFCAAPPLIVLFTEMSKNTSPARKSPVKTWLLVAGCALGGWAARMLLCGLFHLPLTAAAFGAGCTAAFLMCLTRRFIPPAGAMAVLPVILSEEMLLTYPLQVCLGAGILILTALLLDRKKENQGPCSTPVRE
ncbi:MAG: HPP family protein [Anaerovoracaceae bacterium]